MRKHIGLKVLDVLSWNFQSWCA